MRQAAHDRRSEESLRRHYETEKELADRLRRASRAERGELYPRLYDELFRRVPDHPQLVRKSAQDPARAQRLLNTFLPFLGRDSVFLEIGAGDGSLSALVARHVRQVDMIEVSREVLEGADLPDNCQLFLSDGTSIPVPPSSVDLAFSNQVMEHLHPDDVLIQLENIFQALKPAGRYLFFTPNRLNGPHDISKFFDDTATGFHLREYTNTELIRMLRDVGFSSARPFIWKGSRVIYLPGWSLRLLEGALGMVTMRVRRRLAMWRPFAVLLGINVIATK